MDILWHTVQLQRYILRPEFSAKVRRESEDGGVEGGGRER